MFFHILRYLYNYRRYFIIIVENTFFNKPRRSSVVHSSSTNHVCPSTNHFRKQPQPQPLPQRWIDAGIPTACVSSYSHSCYMDAMRSVRMVTQSSALTTRWVSKGLVIPPAPRSHARDIAVRRHTPSIVTRPARYVHKVRPCLLFSLSNHICI